MTSKINEASGLDLACVRPLALAAFAAFALSGCASWSDKSAATSAVEVPTQWSTTVSSDKGPVAASSLAQWWQRFNDPVLSALVTQALQANTSIRSAQATLQQARALRDVKTAGMLPGVGASGSAGRSKSGDNDASNSFRVGLDASWEPDIFGGKRSTLNASEADAQAAQTTLADVQVSIAAEVALAYIQLRGQQAQLLIAQSNFTSQSETLQITDWRAQAGLITSLEVEQARAATEQTRAQVPALQASIAKTRHSLAVLTGQPPDSLQTLISSPTPVPQAAPDLALSIPAQTLRQRPDVRTAEHRISAALARVSAADAARYPSFSIGGKLTLGASTLALLTSASSLTSSLVGNMLSIPLFDGGAARAQVLAQEAALEQARVNYQAVVLTALKDVEDALVALQGDRTRRVHLQNAATAADNAALMAQQRFSSGLIDFQTVLQTQRTLLSAQDSVANNQADISLGHVRLYKALGGGWN
ncbi:MAG: efflux transporter outer membrane subunit [Gammaproteobacteria bacterium]|uniref:efflux transporter outer membrane subunit n=1 Tax=Rhodoferax sp. TaxID=50421 RepID=UPI0017B9B39B|nr:efflux transporter outer membrane subunit [Rhodoferax sp.]MBU3899156.1 efflux transporter outer membrane subunit [Gammaproteobacteria bacterium]MBA3059176.1 efflux transporter outer membrane subunit [Rhodoferax sp.]MBU3996135.1 efflux transporter outer membrane subunit [Gammaproteobacteria bacterium]MBU4019392.1 efflux transporter outer membrane subunit [Gammaproteobacteria bacterium]MBU4081956.1 efflux transporter outer membrane subunit [Gammaproteobacteria bacterium]